MVANWNKMYDSSKSIIFLVDVQNYEQVCESQAEFEILMANPDLKNKPVLLVFNKSDGLLFFDLNYFLAVFDVEEHKATKKKFDCLAISAATGKN
mmetsp:Transcript_2539/g.3266  ORF Transcript_2539/g.3266 Transcript_2539/m.3266 type:complete len:95 (-) Transcript_2539:186-470(-)|eukprot:CAMPEP_0168331008 /NCGR_PEP_ID=MMETSP0213-20121227/8077_1 /TAXON_ID=151035 /ORGANISM="Euplotes harpa, Strain FSP1.4" /LENGTH=94 /DNA_ID=CAMNT_0008334701 /DNA_START=253 /DNA_END=537 /DNA_ORIENTATION=+